MKHTNYYFVVKLEDELMVLFSSGN